MLEIPFFDVVACRPHEIHSEQPKKKASDAGDPKRQGPCCSISEALKASESPLVRLLPQKTLLLPRPNLLQTRLAAEQEFPDCPQRTKLCPPYCQQTATTQFL